MKGTRLSAGSGEGNQYYTDSQSIALFLAPFSLSVAGRPGAADSSAAGVREFLNLSSAGLGLSILGSVKLVTALPSAFLNLQNIFFPVASTILFVPANVRF